MTAGRACTYDNPATMAREGWLDGRMLWAVCVEALEQKAAASFLPTLPRSWRSGQIQGDPLALHPPPAIDSPGAPKP